ncbi:AbiH family protein [Sphingobacterium sp. HJSM2_6]|uniref:AbiH family protein n=1 Tax=Sphingobacterium sp. HJSM2_6 TaxID=3366264 RepID=UPI003BCA3A87
MNTCLDCSWVDIEQAYFDRLASLGGNAFNFKDFNSNKVKSLNNKFSYLKSKLEKYLTIQDNWFKINSRNTPLKDFIENFKINDISHVITFENIEESLLDFTQDIYNQTVYALNYNYTSTFEPYIQQIRDSGKFHAIEENHIHGELNNPNNPVIFGFGDEHNKEYLQFEEQSNNDVFEHIKSYHYMKTANYSNLIRFLNHGNFRVYILGHSCGLSDRTMFKEIFDHENCKSFRIFHYTNKEGENDFFDKSINLGRHFTDKGCMRKLIVNFNEADAFPQFKK